MANLRGCEGGKRLEGQKVKDNQVQPKKKHENIWFLISKIQEFPKSQTISLTMRIKLNSNPVKDWGGNLKDLHSCKG